tara:strand:- start:1759 stop:2397 length:639 start_codon:yes stop_codon:yes gene_type:complete
MAIKFGKIEGKAKKSSVEAYTYKEGDNKIRMVGDVLPRYVYWLTTADGKRVPMECLGFDRDKEQFTNIEKDWIRNYFPDLKCSWAYAVQCVDSDNKVKVLNLKKKLFESVMVAAEDLGDPTDATTGWALCFKKQKTGPLPFNVEYTLQVLKCKPEPLTEEQLEAIKELPNIDDVITRPTSDLQKEFIESRVLETTPAGNIPEDVAKEVSELL